MFDQNIKCHWTYHQILGFADSRVMESPNKNEENKTSRKRFPTWLMFHWIPWGHIPQLMLKQSSVNLGGSTGSPKKNISAMALSSPLRSPIHCWKRVGCRSRSSSSCRHQFIWKWWTYGEHRGKHMENYRKIWQHLLETWTHMVKYGKQMEGWPSAKKRNMWMMFPKKRGHQM